MYLVDQPGGGEAQGVAEVGVKRGRQRRPRLVAEVVAERVVAPAVPRRRLPPPELGAHHRVQHALHLDLRRREWRRIVMAPLFLYEELLAKYTGRAWK